MSGQFLTHRQADVLAAIAGFVSANGYQPTYRQIGAMVGIRSTATTFKHVSNLQRKGYIIKTANCYGDMEIKRRRLKGACPTCGHRKTA